MSQRVCFSLAEFDETTSAPEQENMASYSFLYLTAADCCMQNIDSLIPALTGKTAFTCTLKGKQIIAINLKPLFTYAANNIIKYEVENFIVVAFYLIFNVLSLDSEKSV